jgi:hypothetical protein
MPYKNKEKQKEYQRKWHSEHKIPKTKQTSHNKRKQMVEEAKDKPCAICKIKYPPCAMDLHHIDPSTKDMGGISGMIRMGSYQKLQEEIDKCIPLCAVCHRLLHNNLAELILD